MKQEPMGNIYLTYDAISLKLDSLARRIQQQPIDAIVMVLQGGSFAGMHMAFATGLPYYFLQYNRASFENSWVNEPPSAGNLLLIEDFADIGRTFIDSKQFLIKAGYEVQTLVVCKDEKSTLVPDYYCFHCRMPNKRFIFPWERHRLNPNADFAISAQLADHKFYRTVWNVNEQFFENLNNYFFTNLLASGQISSTAATALPVEKQDLIIAEFSPLHRRQLEQWLGSLNHSVSVIFKNKDSASKKDLAYWKGQLALNLGYTHFVESEAEQAIYLSELFPELKIRWWNSGQLTDIHTAAFS